MMLFTKQSFDASFVYNESPVFSPTPFSVLPPFKNKTPYPTFTKQNSGTQKGHCLA
jgi:hypothetical protein